jgi:hypothetical protein
MDCTISIGGENKIPNEPQEEEIRQYCYEQWEMGLGATHDMVFAAIGFLKKVQYLMIIYTSLANITKSQNPPQDPPTRRWFTGWLKNNNLHTIQTKPIAHVRLALHTEEDVKKWFTDYQDTLAVDY